MTYLDFLVSEYQWCLDQYQRTNYVSYIDRALVLEQRINDYKMDSTIEFMAA